MATECGFITWQEVFDAALATRRLERQADRRLVEIIEAAVAARRSFRPSPGSNGDAAPSPQTDP